MNSSQENIFDTANCQVYNEKTHISLAGWEPTTASITKHEENELTE